MQLSKHDSTVMAVSPENFHSSTVYTGNTAAGLCAVLDLVSKIANSLTLQNHTT